MAIIFFLSIAVLALIAVVIAKRARPHSAKTGNNNHEQSNSEMPNPDDPGQDLRLAEINIHDAEILLEQFYLFGTADDRYPEEGLQLIAGATDASHSFVACRCYCARDEKATETYADAEFAIREATGGAGLASFKIHYADDGERQIADRFELKAVHGNLLLARESLARIAKFFSSPQTMKKRAKFFDKFFPNRNPSYANTERVKILMAKKRAEWLEKGAVLSKPYEFCDSSPKDRRALWSCIKSYGESFEDYQNARTEYFLKRCDRNERLTLCYYLSGCIKRCGEHDDYGYAVAGGESCGVAFGYFCGEKFVIIRIAGCIGLDRDDLTEMIGYYNRYAHSYGRDLDKRKSSC